MSVVILAKKVRANAQPPRYVAGGQVPALALSRVAIGATIRQLQQNKKNNYHLAVHLEFT